MKTHISIVAAFLMMLCAMTTQAQNTTTAEITTGRVGLKGIADIEWIYSNGPISEVIPSRGADIDMESNETQQFYFLFTGTLYQGNHIKETRLYITTANRGRRCVKVENGFAFIINYTHDLGISDESDPIFHDPSISVD